MKYMAMFIGIITAMLLIQWDKEAGKAFITGGVFGIWIMMLKIRYWK